MDNLALRDTLLRVLKQEKDFGGIIAAEIDGNLFAAADIALQENGNLDVYRIAVMRHS